MDASAETSRRLTRPVGETAVVADGVPIPDGLAAIARLDGGTDWLHSVGGTVAGLVAEWDLEVGEPYPDCGVAWVAPARQHGRPVVLKVQFPHPEADGEADALRAWDGAGAIRLLDHDPRRHALLLERCTPGTHLAAVSAGRGVDGLGVIADLLPELWVAPPPGMTSLADEATRWEAGLVEAAATAPTAERALIDLALRLLDGLRASPGPAVLVHQDLHGDNVLAATRRPWLAIDPKPLAGEREFSVAPVVRSFEFGHGRDFVVGRLARLCGALGLDEERAARWTIVQTVAWSSDSAYRARHLETAGWLADHLGAPLG